MTDAIILHASLLLPVSCPSWQEPLLQALPYAHRLELERREPEARRSSLLVGPFFCISHSPARVTSIVCADALADSKGHALVWSERYELQAAAVVEGVIGHIAAKRQLTLIVGHQGFDDARMSALLERSFGLATQFE
jgi:hypothetical protein